MSKLHLISRCVSRLGFKICGTLSKERLFILEIKWHMWVSRLPGPEERPHSQSSILRAEASASVFAIGRTQRVNKHEESHGGFFFQQLRKNVSGLVDSCKKSVLKFSVLSAVKVAWLVFSWISCISKVGRLLRCQTSSWTVAMIVGSTGSNKKRSQSRSCQPKCPFVTSRLRRVLACDGCRANNVRNRHARI